MTKVWVTGGAEYCCVIGAVAGTLGCTEPMSATLTTSWAPEDPGLAFKGLECEPTAADCELPTCGGPKVEFHWLQLLSA